MKIEASLQNTSVQSVPKKSLQFSSSSGTDAFRFVVHNLYGRGEGVRYAVEQTLGYTVPRTAQQLYRTKEITGEANHMAAKEMLARDLAADVMDTFAPGIIATHMVGRGLDTVMPAFVKSNFDEEAIQFFKALSRMPNGDYVNRSKFFDRIEKRLRYAAESHLGEKLGPVKLDLEKQFTKALKDKKLWDKLPAQIAQKLRLPDMDVVLQHNVQTPGKTLSINTTLPRLMRDVEHIYNGVKLPAHSSIWGKHLETMLKNTWKYKPWQMMGNVAALAGSISIPFVIRAITKRHYGKDAFPGSEEIVKHFQKENLRYAATQKGNATAFSQNSNNPQQPGFESLEMGARNHKWRWFPYLSKTLKEGNSFPLLVSTAFMGVLGAAVLRRFKLNQASITKFRDWTKVYQFERGWPWTSVPQMELTYGLLCGTRLMASRNDSEFRETAIRDCLLGWPTLTYFYDWFKPWLAKNVYTPKLVKQFGNPYLLMKHNGELRGLQEITPQFIRNLNLKSNVLTATKTAAKHLDRITLSAAGLSWVLLAWAEPKLGIWITNKMETRRLAQQRRQQMQFSQ